MTISCNGVQMPSLLHSGSEVSLICPTYFKEHFLPKIETPTGERAHAHVLFNLTVVNEGHLPVKMFMEMDICFLGLKVLNIEFPHFGGTKQCPG